MGTKQGMRIQNDYESIAITREEYLKRQEEDEEKDKMRVRRHRGRLFAK